MDKKPESYQSRQIMRRRTHDHQGVRGRTADVLPGPSAEPLTPYSRDLAASRGMRPLGWNVDTKDFEQPGTDAIVATVQEELPNGPTLLFHDAGGDRTQTARGPAPAAQLKQQGYSFGFPVR